MHDWSRINDCTIAYLHFDYNLSSKNLKEKLWLAVKTDIILPLSEGGPKNYTLIIYTAVCCCQSLFRISGTARDSCHLQAPLSFFVCLFSVTLGRLHMKVNYDNVSLNIKTQLILKKLWNVQLTLFDTLELVSRY